jgi:hypothetical protein
MGTNGAFYFNLALAIQHCFAWVGCGCFLHEIELAYCNSGANPNSGALQEGPSIHGGDGSLEASRQTPN